MIFISTAPGNPSVCCLFVEASQFKKKLTHLSSNISRGDGQGRERNFIFEKENSDIDSIVLQIVGVNFHSNFFLLFTPHGPMKGGKKNPKASRATGLSSTEGLY